MPVSLQHGHVNGNGHWPSPQSKRAFQRSLPGRLGGLEDQVYGHDNNLDEIRARLTALEAAPAKPEIKTPKIEVVSASFFRDVIRDVVGDVVRLALSGKRHVRRTPQRQPDNQHTLNL